AAVRSHRWLLSHSTPRLNQPEPGRAKVGSMEQNRLSSRQIQGHFSCNRKCRGWHAHRLIQHESDASLSLLGIGSLCRTWCASLRNREIETAWSSENPNGQGR